MQPRRIARPLIVVLLVLLAFAPASVALADPPIHIPTPPYEITRPASICGFSVQMEFPLERSYLTVFAPNNGRWFDAVGHGVIKVTATNVDTGKSLDYNISGPAQAIFHADGSSTWVGEGPAGWGFQDQPIIPGYPPIFFVTGGHYVLELDAVGNVTSFTATGHIEDVCAALSD